MKDHEKKKPVISVTEDNQNKDTSSLQQSLTQRKEGLKKSMIFGLMTLVFLGCLYMIFKPSDNAQPESIGIRDVVPQASGTGLQADKQKAYEQDFFEQKQQEKRAALMDLSDYWNTENNETTYTDIEESEEDAKASYYVRTQGKPNSALNSYRNIQHTLGTFYEEDNEADALRRELEELKSQLEQKEPDENLMESQLALMEKSYEMAAKYFQGNLDNTQSEAKEERATKKELVEPLISVKKQPVSSLYREPTNAELLAYWSEDRNSGFITAGSVVETNIPKNSILACVHDTQTITIDSSVRLRLLESARVGNRIIPIGAFMAANVKLQNGRLLLQVNTIEIDGAIISVDISAYDLDGQQGLYIPYSPEMNAVTSIASNMGTSAGTNIMVTSSAGQQLAADLSKGVIQGTSGYFSKKMNTPKVTLKAGHQLFLVPKK